MSQELSTAEQRRPESVGTSSQQPTSPLSRAARSSALKQNEADMLDTLAALSSTGGRISGGRYSDRIRAPRDAIDSCQATRGHAAERTQQHPSTAYIARQLRRGRMRPPRQIVFDGVTDEHNSQKRGIDRTVEDRKEVKATGVLGVREDDGAKAGYERKDDIGCYAP